MGAVFCKTMLVSWALVFSEQQDLDGMEKHAAYCFHTEELCKQAKLGAEAGLIFATGAWFEAAESPGASVACVRQPPDEPLNPKPKYKPR